MPSRTIRTSPFPVLAMLIAASGCAALIYQIVWFQLLSLVIGASTVSLGVVLGTFMGGMCLGSYAAGRFAGPGRSPLRTLAAVEAGIGLCGAFVLVAMPAINTIYAALAPADAGGIGGLVVRAFVAALCLLAPTMMMGATLPVIAREMAQTPAGVARIGLCYAANIFGAVTGCLLAGFYLLPYRDVGTATVFAIVLNAAVAAGALLLARAGTRRRTQAQEPMAAADQPAFEAVTGSAAARRQWAIYLASALSGLTALAAEVVWTRQLTLLLGATVYTFALVLAVFLFGLGTGSAAGALLARRANPRTALGTCQLLLAVAIVWAACSISLYLPYWPLDVTLAVSAAVALQLDLVRVGWVVLPAALLWGASFPLALAAASAGRDNARLTGGLYAANTIGAIVGALATSLILIVWIGSRQTQQLLVLISVSAAVLVLAPAAARQLRRPATLLTAAGIALLAGAGVTAVPALPGMLVAYGRFMPTRAEGARVEYVGEGLTASIAVTRQSDGELTYHNAGKAQASTYPQDMRLQRMLGHLTTLVPDEGSNYLVIGLGAGITAGAVALDPQAERVVIAEIEPLTAESANAYFRRQNFGVLDSAKVEFRVDDGRHFLLTTDETFDGITSDPLDPWVKGAAALYTREFWELVRSRLNPGGVVTVFVQLYETTEAAVRSELATFFEVFPHGAVFANTVLGGGYDAVLLARAVDAPIDLDRIDTNLRAPRYARVAESLREVGFARAVDLFGTYTASATDLGPWLDDAAINTDRNLRLQYLAGRGLNLYRANEIYGALSGSGKADTSRFFRGSPALMNELERIVDARNGDF